MFLHQHNTLKKVVIAELSIAKKQEISPRVVVRHTRPDRGGDVATVLDRQLQEKAHTCCYHRARLHKMRPNKNNRVSVTDGGATAVDTRGQRLNPCAKPQITAQAADKVAGDRVAHWHILACSD